ncbi:MAG TPA: multiheme c-type cytochrome, partial [Desulfosarcina sp.]|nr:multiheme c-type cytochrome [Desulfosarcina sp.]
MRKPHLSLILCLVAVVAGETAFGADAPVSEATQECLACHAVFHPGIVADWQKSRHAGTTPRTAMAVDDLQRRMSANAIPEALQGSSVGCAECHTLRGDAHADTVEHNGYDIHVVVSPDDCATCHPTERGQYADNIMAMAEKNLSENSLYNDLQRNILGSADVTAQGLHFSHADAMTRDDACYYCHGTRLKVTGTEIRDTDAGELTFPVIEGWPNQGVGRVNLDGSRGACSACHTRHQFSIETARKPYTCKECHVGPDVPAFKVYSASKHGNIFSSLHTGWEFNR